MAKLTVKFLAKYKHLAWKYRENEKMMESLRKLSWYSFPCVYTNFFAELPRCEVEYNNLRAKRKRYRNHLKKMLDKYGHLYFVTLTFGDCYESTNSESRKKYVLRWLNDSVLDFYGCLDIGKENGREHFHCICAIDSEFSPVLLPSGHFSKLYIKFPLMDLWTYGFSSCKLISAERGRSSYALNYAFKSAIYSFKSAESDSKIRPFHKRGVDYSEAYYYSLASDSELISSCSERNS